MDNRTRLEMIAKMARELTAEMARELIADGMAGDLGRLNVGIAQWQSLLDNTPAGHPKRAVMLPVLAIALRRRFEWAGDLADLDEAIRYFREAAQGVSPHRARHLDQLGVALRQRFERTGEWQNMQDAIAIGREAVNASSLDDADHARSLGLLGLTWRTRFEWSGELADADEAIAMGRKAVRAGADGPDLAQLRASLAGSLGLRFDSTGARDDLNEAITVGMEAVVTAQSDDPDRAGYLSNLCASLRVRFERFGTLGDLDNAITVGRKAVRDALPVDPDRAGFLSNLGLALEARFKAGGAQSDLEEAITILRQAVKAIPAEHPDRVMYLSNLGTVLSLRFKSAGDLAIVDESIAVIREAVHATAADHPDRAAYQSNLGGALRARFERSKAQTDLDAAITAYTEAAWVKSAAPSVQVRAAGLAGSLAAQADPSGAAELLDRAVRLLPRTASRRLERRDQQHALRKFGGLASDAAALALLANETDPKGRRRAATRALRLLELGRGVLLSQALDTRNDLKDLLARDKTLADRFIELRDKLDQAGGDPVFGEGSVVTHKQWRGDDDRHQLAAAFETTLAEIRKLGGDFETFLLPPEPHKLLSHAKQGPVVVVNVSQYRSDAILLRPEGISSVPLPNLDKGVLIDKIVLFNQALTTAHDREVSGEQRENAQHTLSAVLEWLWDVAALPILDELGYSHTPARETTWPRLWWIPGGLLGFLPIHAAGYHREPTGPDGARRTVMDRVVSSYTPTVRALGYAREHSTTSTPSDRALIVAMPTTPGINSPLHNVAKEAKLVHKRLPKSTLLIEDPAATTQLPIRATVLAHLGDCAIAHFACHGDSHPVDPSQNLLLLHDHETDPLTVASLAPIRLDHARLAYLSACRTASNASTDLIDEAIHLTTAFQLAGYPHVVGTLWEIDDDLSVDVADAFYTALTTSDNTSDTTGAAQALHHTVRAIRDELPATPSLWAAYLHAGA